MTPDPPWLAVTIPAALVAAWLLIRTVLSLVRMTRNSVVTRVPLRDRAEFALTAAGDYEIHVEGRRGSRDFRDVAFALADAHGASLPVRRALLRTTVSGLSRVRTKIAHFRADAAGAFALSASGVAAGQDLENQIVIVRPMQTAMVAHVLALMGLTTLLVAALIATIVLVLVARGGQPSP